MLKIVTIPNPILTRPTKKVERFDQDLTKFVNQMEIVLTKQVNPQGVGLAATQVGSDQAIFVIKPSEKAKIEVFVNPKIVGIIEKPHSAPTKRGSVRGKAKLEGCLSIPKIWSAVERNKKVLLEYQDVEGKLHKKWFMGFKGIIIQHEVDHLNGILFTQRALEQNQQLYEEKKGKLQKLEY